ncbi:MAG: tRNA (adenosine(37)-N6)-threonylcarbamoyltransferase complex ATPase subunit type 1 TsaE [Saccharofermentanales bacterium]
MNPENDKILNSHTFIDEMIYSPGGNLFSVVSRGYDDTVAIARVFASYLTGGDIICMDGDLGAGKTAFASGIASGLGIEGIVPSPTFTILHEYSIHPDVQNRGLSSFYHFDVYRLSGDDDFYSCGFDEYLRSEGSVCVVEWADRIRGVFPPDVLQVLLFRPEPDTAISESAKTVEIAGADDRSDDETAKDADDETAEEADVSNQHRKILFYFPAGDNRAERFCLALQSLHFEID